MCTESFRASDQEEPHAGCPKHTRGTGTGTGHHGSTTQARTDEKPSATNTQPQPQPPAANVEAGVTVVHQPNACAEDPANVIAAVLCTTPPYAIDFFFHLALSFVERAFGCTCARKSTPDTGEPPPPRALDCLIPGRYAVASMQARALAVRA